MIFERSFSRKAKGVARAVFMEAAATVLLSGIVVKDVFLAMEEVW
jgi:hypothetical protein